MVRVISLNLNGVRAAFRKGLPEFLEARDPDVLCVQELKAHEAVIPALPGFEHAHWHPAERRGYSGVGILSKRKPDRVMMGMGCEVYDLEGRVIRADFGNISVLSVYVPSGSSQPERQRFKMRFLEHFREHVASLLSEGRSLLLCGDLNIAHREIDLTNWRANQKTSGFLPEERAWFDSFLELGLVDTYRDLVGPDAPIYSWWSLRTGARARNVGWRLDYQLATPDVGVTAYRGDIPREPVLSDHAPVELEYALDL